MMCDSIHMQEKGMYLLGTRALWLVEDRVSVSLLGCCCSLIGVMLADGEAGAS